MFQKNVRCFPNSSADDVYSCLFRQQNKRGEERIRNRKSSDIAQVKIKDVSYTLPSKYDKSTSDDQLVLKVNVAVKNTGKDPLNVDSMDFTLYQGDTKMSDTDPEDYSEKLQGSTINADKSVEGNLFFVVDKGKQYELNYTPESYGDKKPKSVTFKIDGKDKNPGDGR